jgi:hypothetical protein
VATGGKGDLSRKYIRAAAQRLVAVEFLFGAALYFEAIYLGGYVIECSLKALILSRIPYRRREEYAASHFRGRSAHDFEALRVGLAEQGTEAPGEILRNLRRLQWSTNLRYEVGNFDEWETREFIAVAKQILRWAQRSM